MYVLLDLTPMTKNKVNLSVKSYISSIYHNKAVYNNIPIIIMQGAVFTDLFYSHKKSYIYNYYISVF